MATGTPATPEEMKKKAEELAAEAAYYEALTKRDTAKKAAEPPAPNAAAAAAAAAEAKAAKEVAARKAEGEAVTAEATARKALTDADTAKAKAITDAIPSAGIPGNAEGADGAGKAEAMLLGAAALRSIAVQFAGRLMNANRSSVAGWVLCTAAAPPRFDQLAAFDAQHQGLKDALARAGIDVDKAAADSVGAGVSSVTMGLTIVDKLLGFFRSDHKLTGMDVASAEETLVVALAEQLLHLDQTVCIPAFFQPPPDPDSEIVKRLAHPFEWADRVQSERVMVERQLANEESARVQAQAIVDDPNSAADAKREAANELKKIAIEVAREGERLTLLKGLLERLDAWVKTLTTPDAQARLPVAQVAQQGQLRKLLDQGGAVVMLQPHKLAGGLYVKRNFWSVLLWFTPFHVMGGAVASFTAFHGRTGALIASSYQARHGGYHLVTRVREYIDRAMSLMAHKPHVSNGRVNDEY